jgi:hypothetical protein
LDNEREVAQPSDDAIAMGKSHGMEGIAGRVFTEEGALS